jgi:hypothetical protein
MIVSWSKQSPILTRSIEYHEANNQEDRRCQDLRFYRNFLAVYLAMTTKPGTYAIKQVPAPSSSFEEYGVMWVAPPRETCKRNNLFQYAHDRKDRYELTYEDAKSLAKLVKADSSDDWTTKLVKVS